MRSFVWEENLKRAIRERRPLVDRQWLLTSEVLDCYPEDVAAMLWDEVDRHFDYIVAGRFLTFAGDPLDAPPYDKDYARLFVRGVPKEADDV